WLGGIIYATEDYGGGWWGGGVEKGFHAVGDDLIGIFTLVINSVAAAYLLMYSALSKRGKDFRWTWLVYLITG
ncbi:MAG: hypothetical protein ACFFBI_12085, partial [Promethearchaeota archaeon]